MLFLSRQKAHSTHILNVYIIITEKYGDFAEDFIMSVYLSFLLKNWMPDYKFIYS